MSSPQQSSLGILGSLAAELRLPIYDYCNINSGVAVQHYTVSNSTPSIRSLPKVIRITPLAGTSRTLYNEIKGEAEDISKPELHEITMRISHIPYVDYVAPPATTVFPNARTLTITFDMESANSERQLELDSAPFHERMDSSLIYVNDIIKSFPDLDTIVVKMRGCETYKTESDSNAYSDDLFQYARSFESSVLSYGKELGCADQTPALAITVQHFIVLRSEPAEAYHFSSTAQEDHILAGTGEMRTDLGFERLDLPGTENKEVEAVHEALQDALGRREATYWAEVLEKQWAEEELMRLAEEFYDAHYHD